MTPQPPTAESGGTPECDNEGFEVWTREYGNVEVIPLERARQLETDRNQLREKLAEVTRERDALKAEKDKA
jgi:hypothetical protein